MAPCRAPRAPWHGPHGVCTSHPDPAAERAARVIPGDAAAAQAARAWSLRIVVTLSLTCVADPAAAHWEFTRWGMTQQQVIAASRGTVRVLPTAERRPVPAARMEYRAAGEFQSGGLRLAVAFAFDARNGGLVCVSAQGDAAQGPALRARLERLFGAPQERGQDPASGTTTLGWTRPDEIDLQVTPGQPVLLLQCARGV